MAKERRLVIFSAMILMLWAAFALRLHRLTEPGLWLDEMYTWYYSRAWPDLIVLEARTWTYMAFVAPWSAAFSGELGVRWPSVLAGVLSIAVIFQVGRQLHRWQSGLIAAALLTVSPIGLYYSQEARYATLVGLGALWGLWMIPLMERHVSWSRWAYQASVLITVALFMLTAPWFLLQFVVLDIRRQGTMTGPSRKFLKELSLKMLATVLVIMIVGRIGHAAFMEGLDWIPRPHPLYMLIEFASAGAGLILLEQRPSLILAGISLLLPVVLAIAIHRDRIAQPGGQLSARWAFVLLSALSFGFVIALLVGSYLFKPLWVLRYVMPSLVSLILLLGIGLNSIQPRAAGWIASGVLIVYAAILSLNSYDESLAIRGDWKGVMRYVAGTIQDEDVILTCPDWDVFPATYYANQVDVHREIVGLNTATSAQQISDLLGEYDRVLLIESDDCALHNPGGWPDTGVSARWQDQRVDFAGLTLYIYRQPAPDDTAMLRDGAQP